MSLGIADLSKKRRHASATSQTFSNSSNGPSTTSSNDAPSGPLPKALVPPQLKKRVRSQTARPWSGSDLQARPSKSRRRIDVKAVMNEDWVSLHEEPLFWLDSDTGSKLATLHACLLGLEERMHETIGRPLKALQAVLFDRDVGQKADQK